MFVVFQCPCGRYLYSPEEAKTRSCPCKKRTQLRRARILGRAEDARAAMEIVRRLQMGGHGPTGFRPANL
jgi:hypothetical protein